MGGAVRRGGGRPLTHQHWAQWGRHRAARITEGGILDQEDVHSLIEVECIGHIGLNKGVIEVNIRKGIIEDFVFWINPLKYQRMYH